MKSLRNLIVVFVTLALTGFIRLPFDDGVAADLRERRLLPDPIALDTREELGQTGLAIALGGLRPLIAALLNIQAHVHWENQEWFELEQAYITVVALQPRTRYYWIAASHHLASNAYADYEDRPEIPPAQRQRIQKEFFRRGIDFLERGIKANPDDARLHAELGRALSQTWRPRNLERAAEAYQAAFQLSGNLQTQRQIVYTLSRIPGKEADAWNAAQEMWSVESNRFFISPRTIYYALQSRADPPDSERLGLEDIFTSRFGRDTSPEQRRREAATDFPDYWFRQDEGYPMDGIREIINELCEEFRVPAELHPLRFEPDRTFSINPIVGTSFGEDPVTGKPRRRAWRSIWMDTLRSAFRAYLGSPPHSLVSLPALWLQLEEGYTMPEVRQAIAGLYLQFRVPERFNPLRYPPTQRFSKHPVTNLPFEPDPKTGLRPQELTWRAIWMNYERPDLLKWLQERNP